MFAREGIVTIIADYDGINEMYAEDFSCLSQPFGDFLVRFRGMEVAGRMIMNENDTAGVAEDSGFKDLSGMDISSVESANRSSINSGDFSLRIQA